MGKNLLNMWSGGLFWLRMLCCTVRFSTVGVILQLPAELTSTSVICSTSTSSPVSFRILLINVCLSFVWLMPHFRYIKCPQLFIKRCCCADFQGILISHCRPQTLQNCHFMNPDSLPFGTIVIVLWIQELLEFAWANHQNAFEANKVCMNIWGPDWMCGCEKIQKVWL